MLSGIVDFILAWLAVFLDVISGSPMDAGRADVPPYVMTSDMLEKVNSAMYLSNHIWFDGLENDETTEVFADFNDRVMIRQYGDTCYVSFKGANRFTDHLQSYPSFPVRTCGSAGCCWMNYGVVNAYNSDYLEEFEAAVDRCLARCPDRPGGSCELVLTGHSQGAAIAPVAAIRLAHLNPILLTFGQHYAQWFDCGVLDDMETYLRFHTQCTIRGEPYYDAVASSQGFPGLQRKTGTLILLTENDNAATLAYNYNVALLPIAEECHNAFNLYRPWIRQLTPGPIDGFNEDELFVESPRSIGQFFEPFDVLRHCHILLYPCIGAQVSHSSPLYIEPLDY